MWFFCDFFNGFLKKNFKTFFPILFYIFFNKYLFLQMFWVFLSLFAIFFEGVRDLNQWYASRKIVKYCELKLSLMV
jgi:hypothetical protein